MRSYSFCNFFFSLILCTFIGGEQLPLLCNFANSVGRAFSFNVQGALGVQNIYFAEECNDTIDNTFDICVVNLTQSTASCLHPSYLDGQPCDDGIFCNGRNIFPTQLTNEIWQGSACANIVFNNPCSGGVGCRAGCNETARACLVPIGTPCDNGQACDGSNDFCNEFGNCVGALNDFDENALCQGAGPCNSVCRDDGTCRNSVGSSCDDGNILNGIDVCDNEGNCVPATSLPSCQQDFFPCNNGFDIVRQRCLAPVGTPCDDGEERNGNDFCDGLGRCNLHDTLFVPDKDGMSSSVMITLSVVFGVLVIFLVLIFSVFIFAKLVSSFDISKTDRGESLLMENDSEDKERIEKYQHFIDLENSLTRDGFQTLTTILKELPQNQLEKFGKSLFPILSWKIKSIDFLQILAHQEIQGTSGLSTLFRGNSIFSKMTTIHLKEIASDYLNLLFKPLIEEVVTRQEEFGKTFSFVEIDPAKSTDIENGKENLYKMCQKFFDQIFVYVNKFPPAVRVIANMIYEETIEKFPEGKYIGVGSFLFLRFFGPAIFTPTAFTIKLSKPLDPQSQRSLILISKVIQQLANQVDFSVKKEAFMVVMNEFLKNNREKLSQYLEIAATPFRSDLSALKISSKKWRTHLGNLAKIMKENLPKLQEHLNPVLISTIETVASEN